MWALQYVKRPYKKRKLRHSNKQRGKTRTMGRDKEQGHVQAMKRGLEESLPSQPSEEPTLDFGLPASRTLKQ